MPKRLTVQAYLSLDELETRYRASKDPVERSHYQIIWLLAQGKSVLAVAAVTSYSRDWIYKLLRRYNSDGPKAQIDHRRNNLGAEPLLTDIQQAQLWQALQQPAPEGGLWNSRKVANWMAD